MFMYDAIDGPMDHKPRDKERFDEYWSRKHSRDDVINMHPDFVWCCDNVGISPDRVSDMFKRGEITREHIDNLWRKLGGD